MIYVKTCHGTNENVTTGLMCGTLWDNTLEFLLKTEDKNYTELTNSTGWGNYKDSSGNAAIEGYGILQRTGFSDYWKACNIYDLAGNVREYTLENGTSTGYNSRGESFGYSGETQYYACGRYSGWLGGRYVDERLQGYPFD